MGRVNVALCFVSFLLCSVVCYTSSLDGQALETSGPTVQPKLWCVTREGADHLLLKSFKDSVCKTLDCSPIQPGHPCYEPNTMENHSSYALALYYRHSSTCPSYIGISTSKNPSYGKCHFP